MKTIAFDIDIVRSSPGYRLPTNGESYLDISRQTPPMQISGGVVDLYPQIDKRNFDKLEKIAEPQETNESSDRS
jgi:hypothetical protein